MVAPTLTCVIRRIIKAMLSTRSPDDYTPRGETREVDEACARLTPHAACRLRLNQEKGGGARESAIVQRSLPRAGGASGARAASP